MSITIVAAMDRNGLIGKNGKLPWNVPSDLKIFRQLTTGQTVVMGRKTFESIGKELPNRKNIILSRLGDIGIPQIVKLSLTEEVFIIGGAEIYKIFLPIADKLILTIIDYEFEGDTYFPIYNKDNFKLETRVECIDEFSNLDFDVCFYSKE